MNNTKKQIDPLAEVKKSKNFQRYSQEAKERIRLGVEIYNKREDLGMSQQEIAQKAQTTQKVISRVENGDVNIGFALLNRIAKILNFDHENWSNIFDFNVPYKFLFVGSETTKNNTERVKENILSYESYSSIY